MTHISVDISNSRTIPAPHKSTRPPLTLFTTTMALTNPYQTLLLHHWDPLSIQTPLSLQPNRLPPTPPSDPPPWRWGLSPRRG